MKFIRDIINEKTRVTEQGDKSDLHYPLLLREEERTDVDDEENLKSLVETTEVESYVSGLARHLLEPDQGTETSSQDGGIVELQQAQDFDTPDALSTDKGPEAFEKKTEADAFAFDKEFADPSPKSEADEEEEAHEEDSSFLNNLGDADGEDADFHAEQILPPLAEFEEEHGIEDAPGDYAQNGAEETGGTKALTDSEKVLSQEAVPNDVSSATSAEFLTNPEPEERKISEEPSMSPPEVHTQDLCKPESSQAKAEIPELPSAVSAHKPASGRGSNRGRVKTRLLGFSAQQGAARDPLNLTTAASESSYAKFPVGWLAVVDGPGTGATFPLFDGLTQIGRGEGQGVCLDFGDNSISRENHAAIAYDDEQRRFYFGQGGKANLVRLNGRPILSTEEMATNSIIRIGETTLRFVALCGEDFSWQGEGKEDLLHAKIG